MAFVSLHTFYLIDYILKMTFLYIVTGKDWSHSLFCLLSSSPMKQQNQQLIYSID